MFAPKDQDNRRAGACGLTRNHGALARGLRSATAGALCAAAVTVSSTVPAAAQAAAATPTFTPLTLVNGWANYGNGTANAAVASINGIVHLTGGIKTSGTNSVPFTLPAADSPAHDVYVPVDLCNGGNGRLDITTNGVVTVQAEGGNWANAQCFTSLDGVSFATSANSFTPLALVNGWASYGNGTASPAARNISGIVHFEGAMKTTGTNQVAFTLPPGDRPALRVFVPVDLCDATNGDLFIQPDGSVTVEAEGGNWANAQCFTSLDGVSFAPSAASFTPLTLENGWTSTGLASASPAVRVISGIVHLEGDMYSNGINPVPFTLPASFRPAHNVVVKVALCGRDSGDLVIGPGGEATVQAEGAIWANAQCQTALDGVWFSR
ncbi:MAG TPA: hypothetical protein VGS19_36660 [Streptosporangiaceae bacterium]|nr:hypothetical protein [Streptosporangiaceae bacterium]